MSVEPRDAAPPRSCRHRTSSPPSAGRTAAPRCCPSRAYHDPAIHDFERATSFRRDWIDGRPRGGRAVGRDVLRSPSSTTSRCSIVRGRDGVLRAFHNVCRHRGTAVAEEPCGKVVRFQCPYHAWIYDLEGKLVRAKHTDDLDDFAFEEFGLAAVRLETWQGFVFLNLDPDGAAAASSSWATSSSTSPGSTSRASARRARGRVRGREQLEVHRRELQRVLPLPGRPPAAQQADAVRPRRRLRPDGPVAGRLDGARRRAPRRWRSTAARPQTAGRPIAGMTPDDERAIYYYLIWPTTFLSIHPGLPARPPPRAGGRGPHTRSSATGCSRPRRSRRQASTRRTRSSSGT